MTGSKMAGEIWHACDVMRRDSNCSGVAEYLQHISWLLLLKFLDDRSASNVRLPRKRPVEDPVPSPYKWSEWASKALGSRSVAVPRKSRWSASKTLTFVRKGLIPGLKALSGSPEKDMLSSIFKDTRMVICASPDNFIEVLRCLDKLQFQTSDQVHTISQIYEELLAKLGTENNLAGEFYTPRPVVRLILDILQPRVGETLYDPACGTCGFLAEAYETMSKSVDDKKSQLILQTRTFFGNEKKSLPALLGTINLVLHGLTSPVVRHRNTLETNGDYVKERFDVVLTNPPFGGIENRATKENFASHHAATELLFLEHVLDRISEKPGSRCGIVVPQGVLFRGGAFRKVRTRLLSEFDLFLAVALPPGTFAPYSDVETAILFLRRPGPSSEILYTKPTLPEGLKKLSRGYPLTDQNCLGIRVLHTQWDNFRRGLAERPALSPEWWTEETVTLLQNGVDLTPRRPADVKSTKNSRPLREVLSDLIHSSEELSASVRELERSLTF